jgi:hypothetical protein
MAWPEVPEPPGLSTTIEVPIDWIRSVLPAAGSADAFVS